LVKPPEPLPEPLTDEIVSDEPLTRTDALPEYLPLNDTLLAACAAGDAGA
jgi:hypothetical protein